MSATFERGAFERTLDELGSMIGDLWAVDTALELDPGNLGLGAFPNAPVDLGRHHPFRCSINWAADSSDLGAGAGSQPGFGAAQAWVDEVAEKGRAWGTGVAQSLRGSVRDIVRPVPSAFEDAVTTIRHSVIDPLSLTVADDFAHLASSLGEWEGDAATQFADFFYGQVEISVRNQVFAAEAVCTGLAGAKAVVHLGQHSVMGLVVAARDAVESQLLERRRSHATSGMSTADWLALGTMFVALAGAIPTGGTTLTLAAGASAAANATSALLTYSASHVDAVDGESKRFVVSSADRAQETLVDELDDLRARLRTHWSGLEDAMGALRDLVVEVESAGLLTAPRPRLMLGGIDPSTWRHESSAS